MIEMKDELFAAPVYEWHHVPFTESHHKWWLQWYKIDDDGGFFFSFVSPKKRRYSFFTEKGKNGGRVTDADIAIANGTKIAWYWESWGDMPEKMEAVLRLTPKHIIDRLYLLLATIG